MTLIIPFLLIGMIGGTVAGLLGLGGGVIFVPSLLFLFTWLGFPSEHIAQIAVGTSLAIIVVTSAGSVYGHHAAQKIEWALIRDMILGLMVGALLSGFLAVALSSEMLMGLFGLFICLVALKLLFGFLPKARWALPGRVGLTLSGTSIALLSGLFGIGGGSLLVPFFNACGLEMRRAIATSAACGMPIAVVGALSFSWVGQLQSTQLPPYSTGFIYWPAFFGVIITSALFARLGAALTHRLPTRQCEQLFALLLFVLGVRLLFNLFA